MLLALSRLKPLYAAMEWLMSRALRRWTDLDVRDYASLLKLSGDYSVMELAVEEGDWVEGKTLKDCDLGGEGVTVLGIQRDDGSYVGAPRGGSKIYAGDTLLLYGRSDSLTELDRRREGAAGDSAHREAVSSQQRHQEIQEEQERKQEEKQKHKDNMGIARRRVGAGTGREMRDKKRHNHSSEPDLDHG